MAIWVQRERKRLTSTNLFDCTLPEIRGPSSYTGFKVKTWWTILSVWKFQRLSWKKMTLLQLYSLCGIWRIIFRSTCRPSQPKSLLFSHLNNFQFRIGHRTNTYRKRILILIGKTPNQKWNDSYMFSFPMPSLAKIILLTEVTSCSKTIIWNSSIVRLIW